MLKKLIELGVVPVQIPEEEKTRQLDHLEAMVGVLPDAYRLMLSHFGGDLQFSSLVCFRADIPSPWACSEGKDALEILYGLTSKYKVSASEMFGTYIGRIPTGGFLLAHLPVAIRYASTRATKKGNPLDFGITKAN